MSKRDILVILAFILIVVAATFPVVNFRAWFGWRDMNAYETVLRTIELLLRRWLWRI